MLALQVANLVRVWINFGRNHAYRPVGTTADLALHQNHVGNVIALKAQPNPWLLLVHLGMAVVWVVGTMVQKALVARAAGPRPGTGRHDLFWPGDPLRIHAWVGRILFTIGVAGILAGFVNAFISHGNEPMRRFLLTQPLFFLPPMIMVMVSARKRTWSIRTHRFWAHTAFLGPGLATLWTEILINVFGRVRSIGPRGGDLLGSELAALLGVVFVIVPAWVARRRGILADARANAPAERVPGPTSVPA